MNITIKLLEEGDTETVEKLTALTEIFAEESAIYCDLGFNRDKFKDYISSFTQDGSACLVASIGEEVVGYAPIVIECAYIDKLNLEVVSIYVPPAHRNSGVGDKLAGAICDLIDQNQVSYAQVTVCAHFKHDRELINRATERLFKRRGFEQIGTILGRKGA